MDVKLVAWARAVKSRNRWQTDRGLPVLWVFTDDERLPDPRPVLAELPRGLCGLVLRSRCQLDPAMVRDVARRCRERRVVLVRTQGVGDGGFGQHGVHCGSARRAVRGGCFRTASAHDRAELRNARRCGASGVFLSPVFSTRSHPGARSLGVVRWAGLARHAGVPVLALGGIGVGSVSRLPRSCRGVGIVGAALKLPLCLKRHSVSKMP